VKKALFFCMMIAILAFSACSKTSSSTLVGKWVLTKSCACNSCTQPIASYQSQAIVFSSDGRVQLYESAGNSELHYSGSYSVSKQANGKILNINVDAPDSIQNFLYIPGSVIISETSGTLVLSLNTPFANMCAYINTYTSVPN
jgi:hypothetical protein